MRRHANRKAASQGGLYQALRCAANVLQAIDRRMPEAHAVAAWFDQHRTPLGLADDEDFAGGAPRHGVSAAAWRRLQAALAEALRGGPDGSGTAPERWLDALGLPLGLDALERGLLALALYYRQDDRMERLVDLLGMARGLGHDLRYELGTLSLLLAEPPARIEAALQAGGRLRASGLLSIDHGGSLAVLDQLVTLVRRGTPPETDPFEQLLGGARPAALPWDAFAHLGREAHVAADLLAAALARREPGVNILLYGPPGTGKTSFAATLAARAGGRLRSITEQDEAGDEPSRGERLRGLQLAQRLAPVGETVLLFDEAEDVFPRRGFGMDPDEAGSRVFMHRLLEQGASPVIWTANDIAALGPAVIRRMTMCLELKVPGIAARARLWRQMGERQGVVLAEADAHRLARLVPAAPALAATALRATQLAGGDAATARLIVEGTARAVAGGHAPPPLAEPPEHYDPALVRADADVSALAERLARPGASRAVSLLISGPPGTGKSALVRHLAVRMGLDVLHRRASDLLGPFVGETEANIAAAFAEAARHGSFLIFDEADSLLGDRAGAVRSWEVSQVNEMLTWMEQHPLPFACTTNLPDRLDAASLRRFLIKLRLGWLTAAQARRAFQEFFGLVPPDEIDGLLTLTPADFALVRRRAALLDASGAPVALLAMLAAECEGRQGGRGPIGFGRHGPGGTVAGEAR